MEDSYIKHNTLTYTVIPTNIGFTEEMMSFVKDHDDDFFPPLSSRKRLAEYVQSIFDIDGRFITCFDDERLVGLMGIGLNHPEWLCFYNYLAIDNAYRSRGIAQELFNRAELLSREHGCTRVVTRTWSTNQASQQLFLKQGFSHVFTVTDDRGKGVHTYYFAKSLSTFRLKNPVTCLGIIGGLGTYAAGNFVMTLANLRSAKIEQRLLPFVLINDPDIPKRTDSIVQKKEQELIDRMNIVVQKINQETISHLVVLCFTMHPFISQIRLNENVELIDLVAFTKHLIQNSKRSWILIATVGTYMMGTFSEQDIKEPNEEEVNRIYDIIFEIKEGIEPSYYREEILKIAKANNCNGIILGCTELHKMFGFEKKVKDIEILDPLLEFSLLVEANRKFAS